MNIIIINGPNLNLLGRRELDIYGHESFDIYFDFLKNKYNNIFLSYYQSNVEGDLINKIQDVGFSYDGIIINPGGYSHTSIAILDAIKAIETPVVEVHVSNIYSREVFRRKSLISPVVKGGVFGLGLKSYELALNFFII